MMPSRRLLHVSVYLPILLLLLLAASSTLHSQGIINGFPYNIDIADTAPSAWLPQLPSEAAGAHGFLSSDADGNLAFADGTPARFFGVTMQWGACFPDSAAAITFARRFHKLGVNLVRFEYFDHSYAWAGQGSTYLDLATGSRRLNPEQMQKLDWFIYQLKLNGVYCYIPLQSARVPLATDGLDAAAADSLLWLDRSMNFLYPQVRATQKVIIRALLEHVNPYTGKPYRSEPAVALFETLHDGSLLSYSRLNYTEFRPGQGGFSYTHSRRFDTLYNNYLRTKYGSQAALTAAWKTSVPPGGGANVMREGSFEGDFEKEWAIDGYDGTSISKILTQTDSTPDGALALKLRVRGTKANIYTAYMVQSVMLKYNTVYTLSFRAKSSNPEGRQIMLGSNQTGDNGMGAGLSGTLDVKPYWTRVEKSFIVPIRSTVPINIVLYYGDRDGDLFLDDFQLKEYEAVGVTAAESLDNYSVVRIPWGNNAYALVTEQRVNDQSGFYMGLERDYYADIHRFVKDTLKAGQLINGASNYWASSSMEVAVQRGGDFSLSSQGWDYTGSSSGHPWEIRNSSPLRIGYAGPYYSIGGTANKGQPILTKFAHPFPNRYQAESMVMLPAYSSLQTWEGVIWDSWTGDPSMANRDRIDSLEHYPSQHNPIIASLLPIASHIIRGGLLRRGETTISIQHTENQIRMVPRLENSWGYYAVPGGFPGFGATSNRVVIDSVGGNEFTQYNDLAFPAPIPGESQSDTREILWEYERGTISLDAEKVQGVSGNLIRGGGVSIGHLDINMITPNETATILWVPLDTAHHLTAAGASLLVIASRTEPTGWHWADSMYADRWGKGPMLIDPVNVRLTFHPADSVNVVTLTPLNASGEPMGAPIRAIRSGNGIQVPLNQSETKALWYAVSMTVEGTVSAPLENTTDLALTARPNIVSDRCYLDVALRLADANVEVDLFDPLGRRVRSISRGAMPSGTSTLRIDASDLAPGHYTVRLKSANGQTVSTTISVVR